MCNIFVFVRTETISYKFLLLNVSIINTLYIERCISYLTKAHELLLLSENEAIAHDRYRSACVKAFEIILEHCGKRLGKVLKPYFHTSVAADLLSFKDVFKQAATKSIISVELCERFQLYRDKTLLDVKTMHSTYWA